MQRESIDGFEGGSEIIFVLMLCHLPHLCGVGVKLRLSEVGGGGLVCADLGVCEHAFRMCGSFSMHLSLSSPACSL